MKKLFISFAFFFLFSFGIASAAEVSVPISPTGDVPAVSVACQADHNYTLILTHRTEDAVSYSLGGVERRPCVNGSVSFNSFNITNLLTSRTGVSDWWSWVRAPLEYIIKDTTGIYYCDENFCPVLNLEGAFNNYDRSVYLASSTVWTTVGSGPVFDTTDHVTWSNTNVPPPPPVPTCQSDCFSNVLFLPGLEASRLYNLRSDGSEDQLWEPNGNSDVEDLYMNTDGTSKDASVYTRDIIGESNAPVSTGFADQKIYKTFADKLDNLVFSGKINQWKPYAYDWRHGIDDLIQNGTKYNDNQTISLIGTLQSLVNTSKTSKVTIITHSNGGLLAKALIKKLQDMKDAGQSDLVDHIDTLILVASPQIGTPSGISGLLNGYDQRILGGFLMDEIRARNLAKNMPSAYGLLPSQKYFEQTGISPLAVFDPTSTQFNSAYGATINSYQEARDFVLGTEGRTEPAESDLISPIKGNGTLLTQAETLHSVIDNMTIPSSIRVIEIAGWGKATIAGMTYSENDLKPIYTIRGDKTVVIQSALYGQGTKYWLDLSNSTLKHSDILEDSQLLDFITNTIQQEQEPLVFSLVTDTEPAQIGNRLHMSVHSPITIGATDKNGHFTGKICDANNVCRIEENIPGSTYQEFGEGKYVTLAEGKLQKVTMQGTDTGTFTFQFEKVSPNQASETKSFIDIPVTTQTTAELTVNQAGSPQLALDVTGDGKIDVTLAPTTAFDPIAYLSIMKITIDSLDITNAKKNAFDNRVDGIIKSIQKGKIDKATLKAEKFKKVLENKLAKPDPKKPKPKKISKTDAENILNMLNQLLDNLSK